MDRSQSFYRILFAMTCRAFLTMPQCSPAQPWTSCQVGPVSHRSPTYDKTRRLTNYLVDLVASWNKMNKTSTTLTTLDRQHRAMHLQGQDSLRWQWRQNSRSQSAFSRPWSPEQPSAGMAIGRIRPDTSKRTQAIKWKVVFFCTCCENHRDEVYKYNKGLLI